MTADRGRRRLTRLARVLVAIGVGGVAVVLLRDGLPSWAQVTSALAGADPTWLGIAVGAELVSMGMFARQQRRLLRAFGVLISLPRANAISWSRSAIAISMPAGSALSAGFAFRQFRASGASRATAATVVVLSAVVSVVALGSLYLTGLLATAIRPLAAHGTSSVAVFGLGAAAAVVTAGAALDREPRIEPRHGRPALAGVTERWPKAGAVVRQAGEIREAARTVQRRHWLLAVGAAAVNWLADLACLVAATKAVGVPVGVVQLGLIYLGLQVVRQIPLTPGGLGVVEASLLAGLVATGAPHGAAAAAVVLYRLLSCWLVIPIGGVAWASLRTHDRLARAEARVAVPATPVQPKAVPAALVAGPGLARRPGDWRL